jgi:iron complex transport system ATP-binding protein
MLEVQAINVAYGSRRVLHDISLRMDAGSVIGLIGPNGAGKSTLIRAMSGVLPIQNGSVRVNGQLISRLSPTLRARWVSVVPQARNLPNAFTGWETVSMGRTPYLNWLGQLSTRDEAIIQKAMERTSTLELAGRLIGDLSGGEQQRLLIARALTQGAPFLLLDEPTAHLDLQYQFGLLDLVRQLAQKDGLSILLALHDLNLVARYADRVLLMVDGKICSEGSPAEVLTASQLSQAYHVNLSVVPGQSGHPMLVLPADQS